MIARPVEIAIEFEDIKGARGQTVIHVAPQTPFASVDTLAQGLADRLEPISDAKIKHYTSTALYVAAANPVITGTAPIEQVGALIVQLANTNRYIITVPALRDSVLTAAPDPLAGITIDQAHADVAALLAVLIDGSAGIAPCGSDGSDIAALTAAYRQYRA
jgi:hypothetical protein